MKAVIFTLGCKVNSYESDSLARSLKDKGYEVTDRLEFADIYIINTCAVTAEAEKKSRQAIARARKFNPESRIIVTGCASQLAPGDFLKKQNVALVTGAQSKSRIPDIIGESGTQIFVQSAQFDELKPPVDTRSRRYVKIQDGCDNFCSYCIIPHLRGRENSRETSNIIADINSSAAGEAVLTGINISAYDKNGRGLEGLLHALSQTENKRLRLGSLEPNVITEDFLKAAKALKNFAPHFHLSLQSGSDKVLKDMNRKYDSALFLQKVALIRKHFPCAAVTTDVIAGFPTETEKDFEDTLRVCKEAAFSDMHCFSYSRRTGTSSAKLKDLDAQTKKRRLNSLLELAKTLKDEYLLKNLHKTLTVLFEEQEDGYSAGYSENYIRVYAPGRHTGCKKIKVSEFFKDGLKGEL